MSASVDASRRSKSTRGAVCTQPPPLGRSLSKAPSGVILNLATVGLFRACKGCRGIAGTFCYLSYEPRIGRSLEDFGLEFGLKPVRGLVEVEPRWRQEAEQLDRAGAPVGSGGSLSDDLQSPRPTGSCCLIGSASRRPSAPGSMMSRQSKLGPKNSMVYPSPSTTRSGMPWRVGCRNKIAPVSTSNVWSMLRN